MTETMTKSDGTPTTAENHTADDATKADGTNRDATTEDAAADAANAWEEALIADVRANGGRPSSGPLEGHPILLLWSTGAKSGKRRRSILTWSKQDGDYHVAGTAGGSPTTPAWVANIRKDPNVTIEAEGRTFDTKAAVIEDPEARDRAWAEHVTQLPWFGDYPNQVGDRVIPVIRIAARSGS